MKLCPGGEYEVSRQSNIYVALMEPYGKQASYSIRAIPCCSVGHAKNTRQLREAVPMKLVRLLHWTQRERFRGVPESTMQKGDKYAGARAATYLWHSTGAFRHSTKVDNVAGARHVVFVLREYFQ